MRATRALRLCRRSGALTDGSVFACNRGNATQPELIQTDVYGATEFAFLLLVGLARTCGRAQTSVIGFGIPPILSTQLFDVFSIQLMPKTSQFENQGRALWSGSIAAAVVDRAAADAVGSSCSLLRSHPLTLSAIGARRVAPTFGGDAGCVRAAPSAAALLTRANMSWERPNAIALPS